MNILLECQYIFNPIYGITQSLNSQVNIPISFSYLNLQHQRIFSLNSELSNELFQNLYLINSTNFHLYDYTHFNTHNYYYQHSESTYPLSSSLITNFKFCAISFRFFLWWQTPEYFNKNWNSEKYVFWKEIYIFFKLFKLATLTNIYGQRFDYEYVVESDQLFTILHDYQDLGFDLIDEVHGQTHLFNINYFKHYKFTNNRGWYKY